MDIIIKNSKINGKGVFANRDFKKGEIVLKWNPTRLKKDEVKKFPQKYILVIFGGEKEYYLMNPPERYVNHSCDSNCHSDSDNFYDIAIKDIKKGEEITGDYPEIEPSGIKIKCNCGSKKCKGFF